MTEVPFGPGPAAAFHLEQPMPNRPSLWRPSELVRINTSSDIVSLIAARPNSDSIQRRNFPKWEICCRHRDESATA